MKLRAPKILKLSLAITLFGLCLTTPLAAGLHGQSHRFGKSLVGWLQLYERWLFGAQNIPTDSNGNALVNNHVVLLPLPNTPGTAHPATSMLLLALGKVSSFRSGLCSARITPTAHRPTSLST